MQVFAAADGQVLELDASTNPILDTRGETFSAHTSLVPALKEANVLIGVSDPKLAMLLAEAARGEGLQVDQTLFQCSKRCITKYGNFILRSSSCHGCVAGRRSSWAKKIY
jgi:hypothetical protein